MSGNPFAKATKTALKARIAFDGPSGSGKTRTALEWAAVLAEGGKVALVDTERGSASLYATHFDFDTIRMEPPYDPRRLVELVAAAEANGYAVLIVDSLTHFWSGEGGALDLVDQIGANIGRGNNFAAWKDVTPIQRRMVDAILASDLHVIVTMRSKTEWVIQEDERGRKTPTRVGLAAEQRAGLEYEMTMVGDLDLDHTLTFSKSRCDRLADAVIRPAVQSEDPAGPVREAAAVFARWLADGEPLASRNDVDSIVGLFAGIGDDVDRKTAKAEFVRIFGPPGQLPASRVEEARSWVEGMVGQAAGTPTTPPPASTDEAEAPEPEPEPEEDGQAALPTPLEQRRRRRSADGGDVA